MSPCEKQQRRFAEWTFRSTYRFRQTRQTWRASGCAAGRDLPRPVCGFTRFCICFILLWSVGFGDLARAQGTFAPVVMHTGSGTMLLTDTVSYVGNPGLPSSLPLHIHFGFATAELAQPGVFADSFTISLTGPSGTCLLY